MTAADAEPDPAILQEAADWLVLLQAGEAGPEQRAELQRWRSRSPAHETAWQRAEALLATFRQVPPRLGRRTLAGVGGRRRLLRLGLLALAAPLGWRAWQSSPRQAWSADLRTATGEQRSIELADRSRLLLNTASAVDVSFDASARRLVLHAGEILITTAPDPAPRPRPFSVTTAAGRLRALGTRFSVRQLEHHTAVTVLEGAVAVAPAAAGGEIVVAAGHETTFDAEAVAPPRPAAPGAGLWAQGMLLARDLRLDQLAAELARYHRGVLRCDPAVAALTVSGAFPVTDIAASLALLEHSLPVRAQRAGPWWITLGPAAG